MRSSLFSFKTKNLKYRLVLSIQENNNYKLKYHFYKKSHNKIKL